MKTSTAFLLSASHIGFLAVGFALGIYLLPILTAPPSPQAADIALVAERSEYSAEFSRERLDSDALHWGEGTFTIGDGTASFAGTLAPGPDYRLYLSPKYVETEAAFNELKQIMVEVGSIKTFDGFVLQLPAGVDPGQYTTAVVWCETFGQFITSGQYQP